jgi:hypothetical protein
LQGRRTTPPPNTSGLSAASTDPINNLFSSLRHLFLDNSVYRTKFELL